MGWEIKDTYNRIGLYNWSLYFNDEWCASSVNKELLSEIISHAVTTKNTNGKRQNNDDTNTLLKL